MARINMEESEPSPAEFGMQRASTPSASKRKRSQSDLGYSAYLTSEADVDQESHTPKRNRSTNWPHTTGGEAAPSHAPDSKQRSVRRKRGKFGLSTLSRRHAQEERDRGGSKFLEGSMNDKPSVLPPSLFTRDLSEHSLVPSSHSANVDHLMEDYHDSQLRQSIEPHYAAQQHYSVVTDASVRTTAPLIPEVAKESTFYRFGRMVASSFTPSGMWGSFSRNFKDTKEEMTTQNVEENRKKAQQKAEAEARYAEMKAAGQFGLSSFTVMTDQLPVTSPRHQTHEYSQNIGDRTPGDSVMRDSQPVKPVEMMSPRASVSTRPGSPSFLHKSIRSRKSIFNIHRPSFSTLRRKPSSFNVGCVELPSNSTSALPPEKQEMAKEVAPEPAGTLSRSHSRKDLGKQRKLSQRVSDLELKLADARRELTSAINNASPLPELPSRFEKFTPSKHTPLAKFRLKFVPGKLPSLPSERLLFPEDQQEPHHRPLRKDEVADLTASPPPRKSLTQHRVSQPDFTPVPLSSNVSTEASRLSEKPLPRTPFTERDSQDLVDPDTTSMQMDQILSPVQAAQADLDARLKAIDQAVEGKHRKKGAAKKRKSFEDKDFTPTEDADEDGYEAPKKTKKRKSTSKSSMEPQNTGAAEDVTEVNNSKNMINSGEKQQASNDTTEVAEAALKTLPDATPELIDDGSSDNSHPDSPAKPLDPIYEEDAKDASGKVIAAQPMHARTSSRASLRQYPPQVRSASPNKAMVDNSSFTFNFEASQAVEDAMVHISDKGPAVDVSKTGSKTRQVDTVKDMRHSKKASVASVAEKFEWPDDVF